MKSIATVLMVVSMVAACMVGAARAELKSPMGDALRDLNDQIKEQQERDLNQMQQENEYLRQRNDAREAEIRRKCDNDINAGAARHEQCLNRCATITQGQGELAWKECAIKYCKPILDEVNGIIDNCNAFIDAMNEFHSAPPAHTNHGCFISTVSD